jgi:hypothetical protein
MFHRFSLIILDRDNAGRPRPDHHETVTRELLALGIEGWTETPSVGVWRGSRERGRLYTILLEDAHGGRYRYACSNGRAWSSDEFLRTLERVGFASMPDQTAVFATYDGIVSATL